MIKRTPGIILGVPVDPLSMEAAVACVFDLVESYATEKRPRLVCTVNTDFIADTLSWQSKAPRHPELLAILREADLVTADGMPIMWASRFLGPALHERITGAELANRIAGEAALKGKSIYFLGGKPGAAKQAAAFLSEKCPGLEVAGFDSPSVCTEGAGLIDAYECDTKIVERINESKADILFIAFGNPKQEVFFERNRHRLKVPVSMGVGDSFDFVTGSAPMAPEWLRQRDFGWLSRLVRDPMRLAKRYLVDFLKFGLHIWPAVISYQFAKRTVLHVYLRKCKGNVSYKFMTRGAHTVLSVTLPGSIDIGSVPRLASLIPKKPSAHLILDASLVEFVDSAGLGLLLDLFLHYKHVNYQVSLAGLSPYVKKTLVHNRLYGLFAGRCFASVDEALTCLDTKGGAKGFVIEVEEGQGTCRIILSGELNPLAVSPHEIGAAASLAKEKGCTIDLSGLVSINTMGVIFLLKLKKRLEEQGKTCRITRETGDVKTMLRIMKVKRLL